MTTEIREGFNADILQALLDHRSPGGTAAGAVEAFCADVGQHRDRQIAKLDPEDPTRREIVDIADAAIERARLDCLKLPEIAA
jgi:hypothetical protein